MVPLLLVRLVQATLVQGHLLVHLVEVTLVPLVEATQAVHHLVHQVVATLVLVPLGLLVGDTLVRLVLATLAVPQLPATRALVPLVVEGTLVAPLVATLAVPLVATLAVPRRARATQGPPRWTRRWPSGSRRWTRTTPGKLTPRSWGGLLPMVMAACSVRRLAGR